MKFNFTLLAFIGFAAISLAADFEKEKFDNWHHWRGPLATGEAPKGNPPIKWDEKTNIRWKTELKGKGSATPIVWGDRVFVLTAEPTGRKVEPEKKPKIDPNFEKKTTPPDEYYRFLVMCFDRVTGAKK